MLLHFVGLHLQPDKQLLKYGAAMAAQVQDVAAAAEYLETAEHIQGEQ
jgi:hypothetical protein